MAPARLAARARTTSSGRAVNTTWWSRRFGSLAAHPFASTLLSASSVAAVLGGLAYELRYGVQEGIANTLGISPDFVQINTDPATTPQQITVLVVLASAILTAAMLLIPALTIWQIPLVLAVYCLGRSAWDGLVHPDSPAWQAGLLTAVALLCYAAIVAASGRPIRWLLQRARRPDAEAPTLPRWMAWLLRQPGAQLLDKLERQTNVVIALLLGSVVLIGAFVGARRTGNWIGEHGATPDQAVVSGSITYGWLGTTPTGLMVVRVVDFCGATEPEQANYVRVVGTRSLLLQPENHVVIRLKPTLRLVGHCPAR